MPRSVEDILKHADELAKRFEDYEPRAEDEREPDALSGLRRAVTARSDAERSIRDAVGHARQSGLSWALYRVRDRHLGGGGPSASRPGAQGRQAECTVCGTVARSARTAAS